MKHDLLLTLGHNSSAIIVNGHGQIVAGYEEERITRKKSDSSFPVNAIFRCMDVAGVKEVDQIYVTHWATDGLLTSMKKKHWQPENLPTHKAIISHDSSGLSHHDTHAFAADWYAHSEPGMPREGTMFFVIDGFGNFGEHISIYKQTGYGPQLVRRFFGYDGSLGLMYQYMTGFLGMKQHEDEYKILGYETHIDHVDVDRRLLDQLVNEEITRYLDGYFGKTMVQPNDPLINIDALAGVQMKLIQRWSSMCSRLNIHNTDTFEARVILGYLVQSVLEGVVLTLVKIYNPTNLICSGGVFYNVKLNRRLISAIPGKLCVYPLAGDQGNALGLYWKENNLIWPGNLNWGVRPNAYDTVVTNYPFDGFSLLTKDRMQEAVHKMADAIAQYGCVNLVRGAMEFGPRAMCNTSTIALPHPSVVSQINRANGRNTVMPMAPVMPTPEFESRMTLTNKVHMSHKHMIVALPYKPLCHMDVLGAAHKYSDEYTGRPQVLDHDQMMDQLFRSSGVLINTSFNVHGTPIVYDLTSALDSHKYQKNFGPAITIYLEDAS